MNFFAATALDRLQAVPTAFWLNILIAIGAVVLAVILVRRASQMNKIVLGVTVLFFASVVCFNWVYERNEPRFLRGTVDSIAPFFPSKGALHH